MHACFMVLFRGDPLLELVNYVNLREEGTMIDCHIPLLYYKQIPSIWTALQSTSLNQGENNGLVSMSSRRQRIECLALGRKLKERCD